MELRPQEAAESVATDKKDSSSGSKSDRKSRAISGCEETQRVSLKEAEGEVVVLRRPRKESGREENDKEAEDSVGTKTSSMLRNTFVSSSKLRKYAAVMVCQW